MQEYLIVIEKAENNYAAFSPDVLGCVATGKTVEETTEEMKQALEFHLENENTVLPEPKQIEDHIKEGLFEGLSETYYITKVKINVSVLES